jgi:ABC-type multidrug transport system ATPase subunit
MTKNPLVKIQDFSFSYKDKKIFENLNLEIYDQSINFIIGPNGSGKTTLIKILFSNSQKFILTDNFQFIWDFQNFYDELYTVQNLKIFFDIHNRKKLDFQEQLRKITKYWNLEEYLKKPIKNLSYGYKQKVLITRSLLVLPELLIIDEPFLGLDYQSYLGFLDILKEFHKDVTFIISTQNPNIKEDLKEKLKTENVTVQKLNDLVELVSFNSL